MKKIAIWLDDIRDPRSLMYQDLLEAVAPGAQVCWVKNYDQFVGRVLRAVDDPEEELTALFFDNDLGDLKEGVDAFNWFEALAHERGLGPVELYAQTANPAAKKTLLLGFKALRRYWENP